MATLSSLLPASVVTNLAAGDSDVTITDSGTGKVEVTVDNVEVADFTTGEIVFNETGANQDFRVEGDTNANLIVADAGVDKVGIGTNTFNTNGGVLQVSNGISFPATQSALSDANTLDDYEEGTWTPNQGAGLSISGSFQSVGTYIKVGRLVTVRGSVGASTSVTVAPNGQMCTNLPFANGGSSSGNAYEVGTGSSVNRNGFASGGQVAADQNTYLYSASSYTATTAINFVCTYITS